MVTHTCDTSTGKVEAGGLGWIFETSLGYMKSNFKKEGKRKETEQEGEGGGRRERRREENKQKRKRDR